MITHTIIGGGIVGLATAYQLLQSQPGSVTVLEKEADIARHQTSHNSGVIHSGIYYKPGSAKALNCLTGYRMMLDFCQQHDIKHTICGKVIVASDQAEHTALKTIHDRGVQNGLEGLQLIPKERLQEIEPHATGSQAIWVPQAGIIDYKQVAITLKSLIVAAGGQVICNAQVSGLHRQSNGWVITTTRDVYQSKKVITCGGLHSDRLARMTDPEFDLQIIPFRGEYFTLKPTAHHLVKTLIYPVPNVNFPFLGVHFTSMVHGGVEAGPNAVWALGRESYSWKDIDWRDVVEAAQYPGFRRLVAKYWKDGLFEMYRSLSKKSFVHALQKLVPEIKSGDLIPGGAGVRAQAIDRNGQIMDDFLFKEGPGILHVVNAPSPAATSSLALGKKIAEKIQQLD